MTAVSRTCYAIAAATLTTTSAVEVANTGGVSAVTFWCSVASAGFAAAGFGLNLFLKWDHFIERAGKVRSGLAARWQTKASATKEPARS